MGLDLIVEGCARPGHESDWRRLLQRSFGDEEVTDADTVRFAEISTPAYERLGAPRVGYDAAADAWIVETRQAKTPEEVAAVLKDFHGYYVLRLVECDGVPAYSNGGLYDGVDETSFRGAVLDACEDVLPQALIEQAWGHRFPDEAVSYGAELLAAVEAAASGGPPPPKPPPKRGLLAWLGVKRKPVEPIPFEEQLKIAQAAGRWFIFWGERGHAIRAWF
jgi:hypothetical protein